MKYFISSLFFICLLALLSCDPSRVYESNEDFADMRWPIKDTVEFKFEITDTTQHYNLLLNLRNSIDFETTRIFLNYSLTDSTGSSIRKRLVEEFLFDRKTGEPFGDSGLGNIFQQQFPLETNMKFPSKGKYIGKISHMMRDDTLSEVLSVGIRVERSTLN